MANEHIGRLQKIGLGKESVSGTEVAASVWLPKAKGVFTPRSEVAFDESAYGIIDKNKQGEIVRNWTEVEVSAPIRGISFGHILNAAFGSGYDCVKFGISGISGTFSEGETITETDSSATGVLRRSDQSAVSPALYIDPVTGTFTGGKTLTGGTSNATATGGTIESPSSVKHHVFRRLNTNTHPSYTIYNNDPIGDERAAYCMLDSLDIEAAANGWATFTAKFLGKLYSSTTSQTPAYTTQYGFLGKHLTVTPAATWATLESGGAINVESMKLSIPKGVEVFQAVGGTSLTSLHNTVFEVKGDMTLLYNAVTQRDYVTAGTKMALRLKFLDTTTIGSSAKTTLQIDLPVCAFNEWSRTDDSDGLVRQTVGFVAEYDVTRGLTAEALLINTQTTAY